MCGITGFFDFKATMPNPELLALVEGMAAKIAHRGPDSFGVWGDASIGLALGHRRLSIVDLSEAGHQPMVSYSGRLVITYNGEIYNAPELRKELIAKGCQFQGHSDTEVILEACEVWGVAATCQKLIGMFAFIVWDKQNKQLFLARDRLGIKPLYWGFNSGILFFGSQLKSFSVHPAWKAEIDTDALTSYFRFNYVPTPISIFRGMQKLIPGTVLSVNPRGQTQETRFWNFQEIVEAGISNRRARLDHELIEELDSLLRDAVKRRMVADVPLGAFLSGGIDSSTVVALMQAQSEAPIKTFSIGFHEQGYDEAKYAALVAKHLGTDHHELYLHANEAQAIIPDLPVWFDEPFADASQIPTFLVSRMAREQVKVSLSGDGGDELFAGYSRYLLGHSIWRWMKLLPYWIRKRSAQGIRKIKPQHWDQMAYILPTSLRPRLMGDKAYKVADMMMMPSDRHFYRSLISHWENPEEIVLGGREVETYPWSGAENIPFKNFIEQMQFFDTLTYLPDDILTKVDRASMALGLEARVPLLDHRVVEFSWQLPLHMKIRQGKGKWLLRQVLNRYVPSQLIDRPKMGFGVPIGEWLRGPLREWAEDLLSDDRLKNQGLLNPELIRTRWMEHLSACCNWQYSLWGVLMFQAWYDQWYKR